MCSNIIIESRAKIIFLQSLTKNLRDISEVRIKAYRLRDVELRGYKMQ